MFVKENLDKIKRKIEETCKRSGRNIEDINIIAVTKYVSDNRVDEAIKAGLSNFAENRAENYLERKNNFQGNTWHLIGTLQSRKVKDVINEVDYFHALDRISLAKEINKRAEKTINCFLQINVSKEESKHGIFIEDVEKFLFELKKYEKIKIIGLMTMAPFTSEDKVVRSCFRNLKELRDNIQTLQLEYAPCEFLSMGMSNDYIIAIEEGATHIRIGSALVGSDK